jgi:stage V sporulation protein B
VSIIKASFWLTLSELFFNLSGYVTHAILGRTLGPAEYGRYGLIITVSTMIVVLIGRGVPVAMSKYLSEIYKSNPKEISHIKKVSFEVQAILISLTTLLYYLLAPLFANLLNDPTLTPLFRLSAFIIPSFAAASFYVYYFTGIHQFNVQSALKFFRGLSKIFFIISLAMFFNTRGAIIGHALAPLSVFLLALSFDRKNYQKLIPQLKNIKKEKFSIKNSKINIKKITHGTLLNFAWPITLFMLFYEIMITIDLYMVKALLQNDTLTGFYNASLTIGRLPFYAFYFLTIILLPKISETTALNNDTETKKVMTAAMRFLFMLIIPATTLLAIFAPSALRFFYGAQYTDATIALQILAIGLGFLTIFYILAFVLNGAGKNKLPMWTALGGMILNASLNYYLIPRFGIMGAGIATTVTSFLVMITAIVATEKHIASFLNFIPLLKYFLTTAVIGIIARYLPQGRFIFIFWFFILLIIYFTLLWLLREININDLNLLKNNFKKKASK